MFQNFTKQSRKGEKEVLLLRQGWVGGQEFGKSKKKISIKQPLIREEKETSLLKY